MSCNPMPPYERLLADADQMSYLNTVAVRSDEGAYWLGHIQDIAGDNAFIHFASRKAPASWIHAGRVWPLSFPLSCDCIAKPIVAALRDEDDGPFRFRPVVVLGIIAEWDMWVVNEVKEDTADVSREPQTGRMELVDKGQIILKQALTEPALLYRTNGFMFRRYFIPFARAQDVLRDAADKSRIIKHFGDAFRRDELSNHPLDRNRFHLRIGQNGCTFLISTRTSDQEKEQWVVATLSNMLQIHLDSRADLAPFSYGDLCGNDNVSDGTDERRDPRFAKTAFEHLPISLICEIFAHLDLHSCMKLKRVCALWLLLLERPQATEHISICLKTCSRATKSPNLNNHKAAFLLSRTVSSATKSLTILQNFNYYGCLRNLLELMAINVPTIIFKDYTVTNHARPIRCAEGFELNYALAGVPTVFKECCQRVLLYNWKVHKIFGSAMLELFFCDSWCPYYNEKLRNLVSLPSDEKKLMARLTQESIKAGVLATDELEIIIPRLNLHITDGENHIMRRFMWCLDNNFPPIAEDVYRKVTVVHARWVRNLEYPTEWDTIRAFLTIFSGFHADGTPKAWDEVDLRSEDVSTWSRMALLGINDLFII